MMKNKCIYSGEDITEDNNSAAHVFPNAIGGRLKPKNILTKTSNGEISKKIENSFINSFKELLALINPVRDRGVAQRHQYTSELNERYLQSSGGVFLEHLRSKGNTLNDKYAKHSIIFGNRPSIKRVQKYDFHSIIPALYVFSIIFAAYKGVKIYETFKFFVDNPSLIEKSACIQLCTLSNDIKRDNKSICHTAVIGHDKLKKATYVYVEVFGIIAAWIFLPYNSNVNFEGYSVDILSGVHYEFSTEKNFFDDLMFIKNDEYIEKVIGPGFLKVLLTLRNIQFHRFVEEVLREACAGKYNFEFKDRLERAHDLIFKKYNELREPSIIKN